MSQRLPAAVSRLARDSSVLVFLGPIREQARFRPFTILTVVDTYSHGTAASVASGYSAFAPVPLSPFYPPNCRAERPKTLTIWHGAYSF